MIFITGTEARGGLELLSGVLLDPITEADFRRDVFTGLLVSDRSREIVCELPVPRPGIGSASDGRVLAEFETKLFGVREQAYERTTFTSIERVIRDIIENRIRLVTTSDIRGVAYPAFLAPRQASPPVKTGVIIELHVQRILDLPEMQAFALIEPSVLHETECQKPIQTGTILPVTCWAKTCPLLGALEILDRADSNTFNAQFFHDADKGKPGKGDTLERKVTLRSVRRPSSRSNPNEPLEFGAIIGTVAWVC
jgi:hypothetical protein